MLPLYVLILFSEYEFVYDDYDVYSYKWYCLGVGSPCPSARQNSDTYFA
jgi:hypothetical protein